MSSQEHVRPIQEQVRSIAQRVSYTLYGKRQKVHGTNLLDIWSSGNLRKITCQGEYKSHSGELFS